MSFAGSSVSRFCPFLAAALLLSPCVPRRGFAQAPVVRQAPAAGALAAQPGAPDAAVAAAQLWVKRALILRGAYAGGDLRFNARGQVAGSPKVVDWTLAGMDLERVMRRGDGELELDGTRVAIRYNPDAHEFQRHPLKDDRLKIVIAGVDDAAAAEAAMTAIFSIGMDPAFERAAPAYWGHYFNPAAPWPKDELTGQPIAGSDGRQPAGMAEPTLEKKLEPSFTVESQRDRVTGTVLVRFAVDADGVPHRIAILQPLGYGLDRRVVETVEKLRFKPAAVNGKPLAALMTLRQVFE